MSIDFFHQMCIIDNCYEIYKDIYEVINYVLLINWYI